MENKKKYSWQTVPMKDVPKSIVGYLNKHFNNDVVFGIVKEEENNQTFYVFDIDHNGMLHHLKFDNIGNFVSEKTQITPGTDGEHFVTVGAGD